MEHKIVTTVWLKKITLHALGSTNRFREEAVR